LRRQRQPERRKQLAGLFGGKLLELPAPQPRRQPDRAEAHPHQPADLKSEGLEQAAHDAVAALFEHDAVPAVGPFAALGRNGFEARHAVIQLYSGAQPGDLLVGQLAQYPHRVLPFQLVAGVHHAIGNLTRGGEHQQPAAVEVETADHHPFRAAQPRQLVEHGRATGGIVAADDLALGFVVQQHLRQLRGRRCLQDAPVDFHLVVRAHARADPGGSAVHRDAAGNDPLLHVAARPEAGLGQHFLKLESTDSFRMNSIVAHIK